MNYSFRPLPIWLHRSTPEWERRSRRTFSVSFASTLNLLEDELRRLDATSVLVGANFSESDIRIDGMIRANARQPVHPGVEISFDSNGKRFVYATDVCDYWQHNVRSIALGLGALRAVDRYGITRRGEQYAGFAQLAPRGADIERGRVLVEQAGGRVPALKKHHPDHGGQTRDFVDVNAYLKSR